MNTRIHVWVSGQVQGVSFRFYARSLANRLGVRGWVRNLPDGRVEVVFEGDESSVQEMVEFCRKGPSGARVDGVDAVKEKFTREFESFSVKY